ncbi:MAG: hypothetical protein WC805_01265 [Patescibacteria group bacterium]|jgi:hypothetical protein
MGKNDQRTSATVEPVSEGQSDLLVLATKNYPGGKDKLELAKGHPDFRKDIWATLDRLAADQALRLPLMQRPAWKSVELGTQPNADGYRSALKDKGFKIGDWANDIMGKPAFTVSDQPISVDLVLVTVAELGFPKGATRAKIYERALELGFQLCPPEVGPALRLQYPDQPNGEWLLIGMEPIADSDGDLHVFNVGRDDDYLWLYSHYDNPYYFWPGSCQWLFVRGK